MYCVPTQEKCPDCKQPLDLKLEQPYFRKRTRKNKGLVENTLMATGWRCTHCNSLFALATIDINECPKPPALTDE